MKIKYLISKPLRLKWERLGFQYYHNEKDGVKEVFFMNRDKKATIVFKHGFKGRMVLDTTNLVVDERLEDIIEETRKELGLL